MFKLLTGLGIGLVVGITVYLLIDVISLRGRKIKPLIDDSYFKSNKANLAAVAVMIAVFLWLKNIVPALLSAIIVVYLPYQLSYIQQKKFRTQVLEQLSAAVNLFTNTFLVTKNIPRALETVGKRISDPVGGIFRTAYTELTFGASLDSVADKLAQRIGLSYGYIFSNLLKSTQEQGDAIAPLFRDLSNKVISEQDHQNYQFSEVSSVRAMNIFLLILPIPMYLFLSRFEEMSVFATSTAGRIIFTFWLVSIVVWMFLDRLVVDP